MALNKTVVQKGEVLSDKQIKKTFERLGLAHKITSPYTSAREYARNFHRCTILIPQDTVYSSTTE